MLKRNPKPVVPKRILAVLQYYNPEVEQARKLAKLISDLEEANSPGYSEAANFMVCSRYDTPIDPEVVRLLKRKFIKVETHQCAVRAHGFPWGCNAMVSEIAMTVWKNVRDGKWDYDAFLLLECDDVPLAKDWLAQLQKEWYTEALPSGALVSGYYMTREENPTPHINGNCMMAAGIAGEVQFLKRPAAPGAWDVMLFPHLNKGGQKRWHPSKLIVSEYRRPAITEDDLFAPRFRIKGNPHHGVPIQPVMFHGVKDDSALDAARNRLLGGK